MNSVEFFKFLKGVSELDIKTQRQPNSSGPSSKFDEMGEFEYVSQSGQKISGEIWPNGMCSQKGVLEPGTNIFLESANPHLIIRNLSVSMPKARSSEMHITAHGIKDDTMQFIMNENGSMQCVQKYETIARVNGLMEEVRRIFGATIDKVHGKKSVVKSLDDVQASRPETGKKTTTRISIKMK